MNQHSSEYTEYMASPLWAIKRKFALFAARYKCNRCDCIHPLEVHHRTYDRLGRELPGDLEVLCIDHHKQADKQREAETGVRQSAALHSARYAGFCEKVYGEGWEDRIDPDEAEARFDRWMESKGEE